MNKSSAKATPRWGEIRYGYVPECETANGSGDYVGWHPYLIVSNNKFNRYADVVNAFPITSKRFNKQSPSHVNLPAGTVPGLTWNSTVMCENPKQLKTDNLKPAIATLNEDQMQRVAVAEAMQKPYLLLAFMAGVHNKEEFKALRTY